MHAPSDPSDLPLKPKPPFHASNDADREAMKRYLATHPAFRVASEMVMQAAETILPSGDAYEDAKRAARFFGDMQPLAAILSTTMHDPEIAAFLTVPKKRRGRHLNQGEQTYRDAVITAVRVIRQIWRDDFGQVKRNRQFDDSAEAIVAELFGYTEQQVRTIMKKV
jgi:hypothetical protein